jgi:hypothetical protein
LNGGQVQQRFGVVLVESQCLAELAVRLVEIAIAKMDAPEVVMDLGRGTFICLGGSRLIIVLRAAQVAQGL